MKIRNKITVKKSHFIYALIAAAAVLALFISGLFNEPDEMDKIPEWEEFYKLGVSNYNTGSYQSAVTAFKIAIDIDNTHPEAYLLAADAYLKLDELKKAREILKIGLDTTGNQAISDKYDEVMAMPDPIELLPPEPEEDAAEELPPEEEEKPEQELKDSARSDVF